MWLHVRQLALVALLAGAPSLAVAADDWQAQVGEALGKTGATAAGGIYRVGLPRTDLKVLHSVAGSRSRRWATAGW